MTLTLLLACSGSDEPPEERLCNGRADLCDRPFDDVVLAVAHNAMNVDDEDWGIPNQHFGYERQVEDGIRGFMLDIYDQDGVATLCHGSCSLGSEALSVGLARFGALLDAHPDDVMVFVIQDETEPPLIVAEFEAAGLVDRAIVAGPPWPTMAELIDADTRLLVTHEEDRPDSPPWYRPTYALAWDNDYASSTVEDFDCGVLRGDPGNELFLLNHFLTRTIASEDFAIEANPRQVLLDHVDRCEEETGDQVNWLAVDFYDVGDTLSVVDALNERS